MAGVELCVLRGREVLDGMRARGRVGAEQLVEGALDAGEARCGMVLIAMPLL
jgi:hypothetical protein